MAYCVLGVDKVARIISLCNQKGGVGKTTTAVNLAASLAVAEKKTLLVDCDPQGNSTSGLGIDKTSIITSSYEFIRGEVLASEARLKTEVPYLDLIPAHPNLVGIELELIEVERREFRLKEGLEVLRGEYDYILIDSPPSLGLLTLNGMVAADHLLVPVQCEYYALEGLSELVKTIDLVTQSLNPSLSIMGILLTMYDARNNLAKQVEGDIRAYFGAKVFQTIIPRNVRLSEAPSYGKPVLMYDVRSKGAHSYLELSKEFLERMEGQGAEKKSQEDKELTREDLAQSKEGDYGTT